MRQLVRGAVASVVALIAASTAHAVDTNIRSYVSQRLDDFTATATVVKANQRELSKIGKDFGLAYRFDDVTIRYKEPNKVRMEGRTKDGLKGIVIWNGTKQVVSIPKIRLNQTRDLGDSPGKRKTLIDVGLITDFYLGYTNARFLREARVDGATCAVFDMTYKDRDEDTSHHILYVDPKAKVVRKRESYSQDNKLQAVYYFKNVKEIKPGIWFPTLIEAQNVDGVIAGSTAYKNIQVNTGVKDSDFEL